MRSWSSSTVGAGVRPPKVEIVPNSSVICRSQITLPVSPSRQTSEACEPSHRRGRCSGRRTGSTSRCGGTAPRSASCSSVVPEDVAVVDVDAGEGSCVFGPGASVGYVGSPAASSPTRVYVYSLPFQTTGEDMRRRRRTRRSSRRCRGSRCRAGLLAADAVLLWAAPAGTSPGRGRSAGPWRDRTWAAGWPRGRRVRRRRGPPASWPRPRPPRTAASPGGSTGASARRGRDGRRAGILTDPVSAFLAAEGDDRRGHHQGGNPQASFRVHS